MKNVYVVKLGKLYLEPRGANVFITRQYEMTDDLSDARFSGDLKYMKEVAEKIGGKVYEINLEEVED